MLTLVTGVPGAGKTLYALGLAEEYRAQGRIIYHNGIEGLTLPWEPLPEGGWTECPDGAVVFLDEAQRVWRVRPQGAKVPEDVAALETHRHRGMDLILTTQSPGLIDTNVRKLVGRHFHLTRKYGRETVGVYRWEHCETNPETATAQRQAVKVMWTFPRERFSWYRSAVAHTHQKEFPWRLVLMLGGGLAAVAALVAFAFWNFWKPARDAVREPAQAEPAVFQVSGGAPAPGGGPWSPEVRLPRLDHLPATAPYFDPLHLRPMSSPVPAGCQLLEWSDGRTRCDCFTWQGTRLPLTLAQCRTFAREGWFDPGRQYQDPNAEVVARLEAASAAALAATGAAVGGYGGGGPSALGASSPSPNPPARGAGDAGP
jgi:zona occludens toxin